MPKLALILPCQECGDPIEQKAGPGRRKLTCSAECKRARDRRSGGHPVHGEIILSPDEIEQQMAAAKARALEAFGRLKITIDDQDAAHPDFDSIGRLAWQAFSGVTYDQVEAAR